MSKITRGLAAALLAAVTAAGVAATDAVSVSFVHPEKFIDAVLASAKGPDTQHTELQRLLTAHFEALAAKGLRAGERLEIQVLDVDLTGESRPQLSPSGADFRVVRESDWPSIKLHYSFSRGGQVVASADEVVADMNFLGRPNRYLTGDPLRYEKAMLDRWFAKVIKPGR